MGFTKSSMGHPGPMATDLEDRISVGAGGGTKREGLSGFWLFLHYLAKSSFLARHAMPLGKTGKNFYA